MKNLRLDGDAKARYKQLVDQAIADQDEALLAWLLKFAQAVDEGAASFTGVWERKQLAAKLKREKAKVRRLALTRKISSYPR